MTDLDRDQVRQAVAQVLPMFQALTMFCTATIIKHECGQVRYAEAFVQAVEDLERWCAPAGRRG